MCYLQLNNSYVAVIGDIKGSKLIEDRKVVQDKLKEVLYNINKEYSNQISAKFMITLGDEFQGLLNNGVNVLAIADKIQRQMSPVKIRFGIGVGAITTDINPKMAIGADGPAFYKARESIDYLKNSEKKNKMFRSDTYISIDKDECFIADMLNSILGFIYSLKESWTERQREVVEDFICHNDSQSMCAKRLGVTQSTIQKTLSSSNFYEYKNGIDTVSKAFLTIYTKTNLLNRE